MLNVQKKYAFCPDSIIDNVKTSYSHQNMTRITNLIASHLTINCRLYNCERSALTIHFVAHFDACSQWATNTDTKKGLS